MSYLGKVISGVLFAAAAVVGIVAWLTTVVGFVVAAVLIAVLVVAAGLVAMVTQPRKPAEKAAAEPTLEPDSGYPLRGEALFSPSSVDFALFLDNRTAAPVRIDKVVLRAFGKRLILIQPREGITDWFQPVTLEPLHSDRAEFDRDWGLKDGTVPAYSRVVFGVGHRLILSRVLAAERIEIIAIGRDKPVWKYSTRTKWLREAVREWAIPAAKENPTSR